LLLRPVAYLALGLLAGTLSGLIGIGGGVLVVPALVFLFGFSEHTAQGTTLALLVPPIGVLAAWTYYQQGEVKLGVAGLVAAGFVVGSLLGAKVAVGLSDTLLTRVFGAALIALGLKMVAGR